MARMSAQERERQTQARREAQERELRERREHWKIMLETARDGHERTQVLFDQRQENLYRRLEELELNLRDEIREHGRAMRIWLALLNGLVVILIFVQLWL